MCADLRNEIRRSFIPFVEKLGFHEVSPKSRPKWTLFRQSEQGVQLIEIQFEKKGLPRFVINFGICAATGMQINGRQYSPGKIYVSWLPHYGRLQPRKGIGTATANWYRQDRPFLLRLLFPKKMRAALVVVSELVSQFAEIEDYWRTGTVGQHIEIIAGPVLRKSDCETIIAEFDLTKQ